MQFCSCNIMQCFRTNMVLPHKDIWPWTKWFEFDALHQRKRPYIYTFIKIIGLKQMIWPDFLNYSEVSVHLATKYVLQNLWSFNFHKCKNLYVSLWQFRVFNVHFLLVMDCAIVSWGIFSTNAFSWKKSPGSWKIFNPKSEFFKNAHRKVQFFVKSIDFQNQFSRYCDGSDLVEV